MTEYRVGLGIDIHQFMRGRELWLGGVRIPHDEGLDGHSDADVVLHALCDSLLGAAGLGDIGQHFPPTDPKWRNARSTHFVEQVVLMIRSIGWSVANVDLVVIAEVPKIGPHVTRMKEAIAPLLDLTADAVGVKATTAEQMGSLGRREGIACHAVCLLSRVKPDRLLR